MLSGQWFGLCFYDGMDADLHAECGFEFLQFILHVPLVELLVSNQVWTPSLSQRLPSFLSPLPSLGDRHTTLTSFLRGVVCCFPVRATGFVLALFHEEEKG